MPSADPPDRGSAPKSPPVAGVYNVRDVLGDEARRQEFSIRLWCAITGRNREDALQVGADAREQEATYGPPLEGRDEPWPEEIVCDDCGVTAPPFGSSLRYETDVPQHRWVRIYTCMRCYDAQVARKWRAMGDAAKRRREAGDSD